MGDSHTHTKKKHKKMGITRSSLVICSKMIGMVSNISDKRRFVSSDIQTLRSRLKKVGTAAFF